MTPHFFSRLLKLMSLGLVFALPCFLAKANEDEIRLLIRSDDMGVAKSINDACIDTYKYGVARSVEVIVNGSWFLDAVELLKQNPGFDVGVHLCVTSEWSKCKWRPLTRAPSMVDPDGYFWPTTGPRTGPLASPGFTGSNPDLKEVEAELRAQIELAMKHLPNVTHVSAHMGAATATDALRALTQRVADDYGLGLQYDELQRFPRIGGIDAKDFESELVEALEKIEPGTYMLVEHPGYDTPELRGFGHPGYENVAQHRAGVTKAFTSDRVKAVIKKRGIQLISYADLTR